MNSNQFFSDEFSALLEDYHYGELDELTATKVMAHVRGCSECSSALAELERENNIYQAYADSVERNLEVTPAMWENVRSHIATVAPDSVAQPGLFARLRSSLSNVKAALMPVSPIVRQIMFAAVVIVISVTGTLVAVKLVENKQQQQTAVNPNVQSPSVKQETPKGAPDQTGPEDNKTLANNDHQTNESPKPKKQQEKTVDKDPFRNVNDIAPKPRLTPDEVALQQRITKLRQEYVEAIDLLSASINKRKSKVDPKLMAVYNRNLTIVNETIAATRRAYQANPADAELAQYMLTAYSKKVELLQEIDNAIGGE